MLCLFYCFCCYFSALQLLLLLFYFLYFFTSTSSFFLLTVNNKNAGSVFGSTSAELALSLSPLQLPQMIGSRQTHAKLRSLTKQSEHGRNHAAKTSARHELRLRTEAAAARGSVLNKQARDTRRGRVRTRGRAANEAEAAATAEYSPATVRVSGTCERERERERERVCERERRMRELTEIPF